MVVKRLDRSKEAVPLDRLAAELPARLRAYQAELLARARVFRDENTHHVDTYQQIKDGLDGEGGFFLAPWCGNAKCEKQVNEETGPRSAASRSTLGRGGQVHRLRSGLAATGLFARAY